ncbi:FecR domain-containing protein [Fulvivirgaceae bacterium PWU4]|uniref:FecR domain-containing protein n=1 Tax=Chryseosolibacter histidini TaxID=2782349 RepID=A0AAP2GSL2_9BACT|nr:FecR domain-containing protein [Chryseosolibacter histidini]MBT1701290.1 FecR domain-containing protein [Chryseosolibacter histidini]
MDRLEFLLQRYKNNTATPEEAEELSGLMDGEFRDSAGKEKLSEASERDVEMVFGKLDAVPLAQPARVVRFRRSSVWLAAAATLTIVLVAGLWLISDSTKWFPLSSSLEKDAIAKYSGKQVLNLPDGSKVVLNANSELNFNEASFGKDTREVSLIGEATFDVVHDSSKPFVVHTGKVNTKVLGTEFNINAYLDKEKVTVTVLRGLVEVGDEHQVYGQIKPNEQMAVDIKTNEFLKQKTNAEDAVAWQKNFFILDQVTFAEAIAQIEERFHVKVTISNESLKDCIVSAWFFNNEDVNKVVEDLSMLKQATATINGNKIIIEGGDGCKPSH